MAEAEPDGSALYQAHCSGCHGTDLRGALASALVESEWQYGRDDFAVDSNIRNGIPGTEMPAFRDVLNDAEITAVVAFLYAAQSSPTWIADPLPSRVETEAYALSAERLVTEGLESPWGIEFIDSGTALITENDGRLRWFIDGELDPTPITGIPPVDTGTSTGGLLDIALDPAYANNGWIYLAISHSEQPDDRYAPGMTQIIRGRVDGYEWVDQEYLFRLDESYHLGDSKHWGGRLLFDTYGYLYFSIGDMSKPGYSQDLAKPSGKVFRIHKDGSIPFDNPFVDEEGALGAVFTIGNRNVQGLAEHPVTRDVWATEHGPRGGDELNRLQKGANYGWPVVTFGINYDGTIISDQTHAEGIEPPVRQWTPAPAVCPIEFVTSPGFAEWENNLLVGSLSFEELHRLVIDDDNEVLHDEILFKGHGRIRDIKTGPDGAIYLLLNNPDELVRLSVAD